MMYPMATETNQEALAKALRENLLKRKSKQRALREEVLVDKEAHPLEEETEVKD